MKKVSLLVAALGLTFAAFTGANANELDSKAQSLQHSKIVNVDDLDQSVEREALDRVLASTTPTGRYFVLSHVAFQGSPDKRFGWPAYAGSFDDAVRFARRNGIIAFHYYVDGDSASGALYPFYSVTGYEAREGTRQTVGVIMERRTVH